jgi:hypothetical protein
MPEPHDLPGPLGAYAAAWAACDLERMQAIALEIMAADEIVLPHPERPQVMCHCCSSCYKGVSNFLFFADEQGGNRWALVQITNFIDLVVTETAEYVVTGSDKNAAEMALSRLRSGEFDKFWERRHRYGGLVVHSVRPFHYFYDQFIHLPALLQALPEKRRTINFPPNAFLAPADISAPSRSLDRGHYYVHPYVFCAKRLKRRNLSEFYERAGRMERWIAAAIPARLPEPRADLVLWVGITGQKRSWLEQVDGYAAIVRQLTTRFPDLLVYVDGLTSPQGTTLEAREDKDVVQRLIAEIGNAARVESLVGADYPEKIARCHAVDIFIANGGTGCFVPLRICRKPGILHSNKTLWTFGGDEYPDTVVFTPPEIVREIPSLMTLRKDIVSYSIAWQEIYNRLVTILEKVMGVRLDPLTVPPVSPEFDQVLVGQLLQNLTPDSSAAEILGEVAVLFEAKNDFATALAVMKKAHLQGPDEPVFKRKLGEYRQKLAMGRREP